MAWSACVLATSDMKHCIFFLFAFWVWFFLMGSGLGTCTAFASCCLWVSEGAWFWFCPHGKPLESWQLGRVGFYHLQKDEVRLRGMYACVFASGFQMWAVFIVNFGESCGFIWLSFKCWVSLLSKKYIYRLWNADTVMIRSWNPGAVTISIVSPAGAGKVLHACLGGRKYGHSYLGSAAFSVSSPCMLYGAPL